MIIVDIIRRTKVIEIAGCPSSISFGTCVS
jgi:hypothetical protein